MKVLHICANDNTGAGLCCLRIHKSLLNNGIESKVLTRKCSQNVQDVYEYGAFILKMSTLPSKLFRMFGFTVTKRNIIMKLMRENNTAYSLPTSPVDVTKHALYEWADIIHLHWVCNYLDMPSFFYKCKKPVVWTLHDENLFYGIAHHHKSILENNPLEIKYKNLKREAVSNANNLNIVFLSEMMYNRFGTEDFIANRHKVVINNAVDPSVFSIHDKKGMREKYGLDMHKTIFAFVASDIGDPNKGLQILAEVLNEMDPLNFQILAIGSNSRSIHLPLVISIGKVYNQNTMSEVLSAADYFAMPSYQEAFPQSPLEAMACGLPVVAFPVSGTSEMINEQNGVVCTDFSKDSLRIGIEDLLSKKYSPQSIRHDVVNRFSPDSIAQKYIDLYNKILKEQ